MHEGEDQSPHATHLADDRPKQIIGSHTGTKPRLHMDQPILPGSTPLPEASGVSHKAVYEVVSEEKDCRTRAHNIPEPYEDGFPVFAR